MVIGDVAGDNVVNAADIAKMKQYFLGAAELTSQMRADVNDDNLVTLKDLVKLKYAVADAYVEDFNIGGSALSDFALVTPDTFDGIYTVDIEAYLSENFANNTEGDAQIIIGNADDYSKAMNLTENEYEIEVVGNKLYINGGSANALKAALKTFEGYIKNGASLEEGCVISFTFHGDELELDLKKKQRILKILTRILQPVQ